MYKKICIYALVLAVIQLLPQCTSLSMMSFKGRSLKLYNKAILDPMDFYNSAMRLYMNEQYWDAGFAYGKVIAECPMFHLNDKAAWYLGDCYTRLHLNAISREVLTQALATYPKSEQLPRYVYGLLRLDYLEGRYDDALKNYLTIVNKYPESDIRSDADYLAGQIMFIKHDFNGAEQVLKRPVPGDPCYLYAQYTLSIINIEKNREGDAVHNLEVIVNDSSTMASDSLLRDAANLKLGHIYFESGKKFRQAVEAYRRVPEWSPYEDEALLGIAWAWMKVNRPREVLETLNRFFLHCGESSLVPEAYLLKGYAFMLLRQYENGITAFEQSRFACSKRFLSADDLNQRRARFEEIEERFAGTAEQIKKNALSIPNDRTLKKRPELKKEYLSFADECDAFFKDSLTAASDRRFFSTKEDILKKVDNLDKGIAGWRKRPAGLEKVR